MEAVLDTYRLPHDPLNPVICMDESPSRLLGWRREPYRTRHAVERLDYEYVRKGTVSAFAAVDPHAGRRIVEVRDTHKACEWVAFMLAVSEAYPDASTITVVLDNFTTHRESTLQRLLGTEVAARFRLVHTPVHGSWLNMAEIEPRVLIGQCLGRRMPDIQTMRSHIKA